MEQAREFFNEIRDLDRRELISINYLKRWLALIVIVFVLFNYMWNSLFSDLRDSHIPFALLPPELQYSELKMPYRSATEIRQSQINQINFVIFACTFSDDDDNTLTGKTKIAKVVAKEAIRTMKSATIFTKKIIHFHVFTEDVIYQIFIAELDKWPNNILHRVTFQFRAANYPEAFLHGQKDKQTQKACDLSFLFIPSIIKDLDFAIYAKTGSIFLSPIDELWMNFRDYNEENSLALPLKRFDGTCKLFENSEYFSIDDVFEATIVQYDNQRLQAGLFRIPISRKLQYINDTWFPLVVDHFDTVNMTWNPLMLLTVFRLFKPVLTSPGVDLLNVIASFNPHKIYALPCEWNFDVTVCNHCDSLCPSAKLITENEIFDKCFNLEFQLLAQLVDDIDLKVFNVTQVHESILNLKNEIYQQWPSYSFCSLKNLNSICR